MVQRVVHVKLLHTAPRSFALCNCFLSQTSPVNIFCSVLAEIFLSNQALTLCCSLEMFFTCFMACFIFFFPLKHFLMYSACLWWVPGVLLQGMGCAWLSRQCSHSRVVEWAAVH